MPEYFWNSSSCFCLKQLDDTTTFSMVVFLTDGQHIKRIKWKFIQGLPCFGKVQDTNNFKKSDKKIDECSAWNIGE